MSEEGAVLRERKWKRRNGRLEEEEAQTSDSTAEDERVKPAEVSARSNHRVSEQEVLSTPIVFPKFTLFAKESPFEFQRTRLRKASAAAMVELVEVVGSGTTRSVKPVPTVVYPERPEESPQQNGEAVNVEVIVEEQVQPSATQSQGGATKSASVMTIPATCVMRFKLPQYKGKHGENPDTHVIEFETIFAAKEYTT